MLSPKNWSIGPSRLSATASAFRKSPRLPSLFVTDWKILLPWTGKMDDERTQPIPPPAMPPIMKPARLPIPGTIVPASPPTIAPGNAPTRQDSTDWACGTTVSPLDWPVPDERPNALLFWLGRRSVIGFFTLGTANVDATSGKR